MVDLVQAGLMQATEIARQSDLRKSSNGVSFTSFGENEIASADLDRIVQAVPASIAGALGKKAYYFVPLALAERSLDEEPALSPDPVIGLEDTLIATTYTLNSVTAPSVTATSVWAAPTA